MKKIAYSAVFVLFFITLGILGLTWKKVRIQTVAVSGNASVSTDQILNIVDPILDRKDLLIVPTDNILLLKGNEIKDALLENIKTISAVKISFQNLTAIDISISERPADNLWCQGDPSKMGNCFSMDDTGFVFATSAATSALPTYFGFFASTTDPVGETYFDSARFSQIVALMSGIGQLGFHPQYFDALDADTYEVYLKDGGKILLSDGKSFDESLTNLSALVNDKFISMDEKSLAKIDYLDLESGNKVFCAPASVCKQGN